MDGKVRENENDWKDRPLNVFFRSFIVLVPNIPLRNNSWLKFRVFRLIALKGFSYFFLKLTHNIYLLAFAIQRTLVSFSIYLQRKPKIQEEPHVLNFKLIFYDLVSLLE